MLRSADGGGCVRFLEKSVTKGVRFNVVSVTRGGWVGVQFPEKKGLCNT